MAAGTKKWLVVLAAVALALASGFAGGAYGFMHGYVYSLGDNGVRAYTLTKTLRALRSGDVTEGISRLESDLDTLVMEHWVTNRTDPPVFSRLVRAGSSDVNDRKLFSHVALYRSEYPSSTPVPEVRDIIKSHLKGFQTQ
jgi:hypothetical protein